MAVASYEYLPSWKYPGTLVTSLPAVRPEVPLASRGGGRGRGDEPPAGPAGTLAAVVLLAVIDGQSVGSNSWTTRV